MSQVPLNDLSAAMFPLLDEIQNAVSKVLASGWFLTGTQVKAFEEAFAEYNATEFAVSVANGTDALEIALRAVGVDSGDEVITVANAGGYSTTAILALGATPVFADIDEHSLLVDSDSVLRCMSPRTRAVVITHLYGRTANVETIQQLVGSQLPIVEDCAQAHGGKLGERRVGGIGTASAFSFYPTKNLGACGDAGMVLTSDPLVANSAQELSQYGWKSRYDARRPGGRNSRMDEVQAAVLLAKLPYLDRWNEERRAIAGRIDKAMSGTDAKPISVSETNFNVFHLMVTEHSDRERFRKRLDAKGVSTAVHYPILDCDQIAFANRFRMDDLPRSRNAGKRILTLPGFPGMTEQQLQAVESALESELTP
jgi:aminotransferase EvaB